MGKGREEQTLEDEREHELLERAREQNEQTQALCEQARDGGDPLSAANLSQTRTIEILSESPANLGRRMSAVERHQGRMWATQFEADKAYQQEREEILQAQQLQRELGEAILIRIEALTGLVRDLQGGRARQGERSANDG